MKVFTVVLRRGDSKWIDSQWVSEESAKERAEFVQASYSATNTTAHSIGATVVPFELQDARLV